MILIKNINCVIVAPYVFKPAKSHFIIVPRGTVVHGDFEILYDNIKLNLIDFDYEHDQNLGLSYNFYSSIDSGYIDFETRKVSISVALNGDKEKFVTEHENGHKFYRSEHKADRYAANCMLKQGYCAEYVEHIALSLLKSDERKKEIINYLKNFYHGRFSK